MGAYIGNDTHQTSACHHIAAYFHSVCRTFIHAEYLEPVAGVLGNDSGCRLLILEILLIQVIQFPQSPQFKLVRNQTVVLLR